MKLNKKGEDSNPLKTSIYLLIAILLLVILGFAVNHLIKYSSGGV